MSKRHHRKSLSYLPGADMWTLIFCINDLFAAPGQVVGMLMSPEAGGFWGCDNQLAYQCCGCYVPSPKWNKMLEGPVCASLQLAPSVCAVPSTTQHAGLSRPGSVL